MTPTNRRVADATRTILVTMELQLQRLYTPCCCHVEKRPIAYLVGTHSWEEALEVGLFRIWGQGVTGGLDGGSHRVGSRGNAPLHSVWRTKFSRNGVKFLRSCWFSLTYIFKSGDETNYFVYPIVNWLLKHKLFICATCLLNFVSKTC